MWETLRAGWRATVVYREEKKSSARGDSRMNKARHERQVLDKVLQHCWQVLRQVLVYCWLLPYSMCTWWRLMLHRDKGVTRCQINLWWIDRCHESCEEAVRTHCCTDEAWGLTPVSNANHRITIQTERDHDMFSLNPPVCILLGPVGYLVKPVF